MITVALSATIGSPAERVWRALIDPAERTTWDDRILGEVELSARSNSRARTLTSAVSAGKRQRRVAPIRKTSWRFRLSGIQLVMVDEIRSAHPPRRLMSKISIGSMHFDQTLTLHAEDDESGPRTRLGMKLIASNSIAVIGEFIPRLEVQKIVIEYVDTTLRQVQKYCERDA